MPNINITDSRKRDAVVKAENTGVSEEVRYVDSQGSVASTRKVLKATVAHDFDTLNQQFGDDPQKLGYALIEGDPEVDMERCGVYLWGVSKVYVTSDDGIVYRIEQTEKVLDTNGEVKETRPRRRAEANVDAEIPLTWTGRKIKKADAIKRFVFSSKLQVVHVNGLTYDFLYGMAKELEGERSLMMVGGGSDGKDPLVFRRGSVPYRGFLEGRIDGEQYILLLHLSNMELKVPQVSSDVTESAEDAGSSADTGAKDRNKQTDTRKPSDKKDIEVKDTVKESAEEKKPAEPANRETPDKKAVAKKLSQKAKTDADTDADQSESTSTKKKKSAAKTPVSEKKGVADPVSSTPVSTAPVAIDTNASKTDKTVTQSSTANIDTDEGAEAQGPSEQQAVNSEDLGVWLKSIRMGKYLELFVANEIDVDVLTELTDDDLKELEIPLGSRRRLLKAVEEADNLRAEVAMAVSKISRSSADTKSRPSRKKKIKKKKSAVKNADKRSE